MAAIQFTDADRDERGFIKAPAEPRSLADLLPTTDHRPPTTPRPLTRQELISAAAVVPLLIGALLYLSSGRVVAPPVVRQPVGTAAAIVPTIAPAAATAPPIIMLPAFAAPDGLQLGTIEVTRAITPTAHYGSAWIQADVQGSGRIWLRVSDWPSLAIVGADLAPRPTAEPVYVAAPEPPPAPPAPPQCAEVGTPGRMVKVCGDGALAALEALAKVEWLARYGGNLGALDSPTPQPMRRRDLLANEEPRP